MASQFRKLASQLHAAVVAVAPIDGVSLGPPIRIDFKPSATAQQISDANAVVAAFDFGEPAEDTRENLRLRALAVSNLTAKSANPKLLRALASIMVDELNVIRQWTVAMKAAVAAASNFADLKTRIAALPTLNDRTLAQAKNAMQNRLESGNVDT